MQTADSIAQRIRFEHEVLRALAARVGDAADRCSQGKPAAQDLRDSARTLHAVLEAHARHHAGCEIAGRAAAAPAMPRS